MAQAFNQYFVPKIASCPQAQAFETGFIGMAIPAPAVLTAHFLIGSMSSTSNASIGSSWCW